MIDPQSSYGIVTGPDSVRFERVLPGPIERVWEYLTDSQKRGTWFAAGAMELRPGGRVQLRFDHSALSAEKDPPDRYKRFQGHVSHGRVTRCEPPRVLAFTWEEESAPPTEVIFELTPQGKDVHLVLTHRRLASRDMMRDVSGGWHSHLGILEDRLADREPRPFWTTHAKLETEYAERMPPPQDSA